ncbi:MAG: ATP-binding cassette domain-containing protein [Hyphomicrobiaceae bacterium]
MATLALVDVKQARFRWPGEEAFEFRFSGLTMAMGERVLLVGPSGSGKSTLLALIAGIVTPHEGHVAVLGQNLSALGAAARDRFRAEHMGLIFQMFNLLPYGSAIDNVLLPLSFAPDRRARLGAEAQQLAEARRLLDRLGLDPDRHGGKRAGSLSVGQQQRVAAARALIGAPELIVADEPTSALDHDARDRFLDLVMGELSGRGAGLLLVSHDPTLAGHFDRVVDLKTILEAVPAVAGAPA